MNYYEIHKNKTPKAKLRRRTRKYVSPLPMINATMAAMSAAQISKIQSQPTPRYEKGSLDPMNKTLNVFNKKVEAINTVVNYALGIIKEVKKEPRRRFEKTGRYVK